MAMGVADHIWSLEEIAALLIEENGQLQLITLLDFYLDLPIRSKDDGG